MSRNLLLMLLTPHIDLLSVLISHRPQPINQSSNVIFVAVLPSIPSFGPKFP